MKEIWRKSLSILLLMITVFTGIPVAASEQILENDQEQIMPASPADDAEPLCTLIQEDSKSDDGIAMTSLDNSSNLRILNPLIVKVVVSKNLYFLFVQVIRYCSVPDVSINK